MLYFYLFLMQQSTYQLASPHQHPQHWAIACFVSLDRDEKHRLKKVYGII